MFCSTGRIAGLPGRSSSGQMSGMKRILMGWLPGLLLPVLTLVGLAGPAPRDFSRWEKEISAFEAKDRANSAPQGAVLFTGSSTIRLWTTQAEDFPGHRIINRGFGGSQIVDCTHFADRIVFPYRPHTIFLRAGGNDIHDGKTPEEVFADFREFVRVVHAQLPATDIVFIGLCPSVARWNQAEAERRLNVAVKKFARRALHVKYLECYAMTLGADGRPRPELFVADQLHLNGQGYRVLAERVRPFLPRR